MKVIDKQSLPDEQMIIDRLKDLPEIPVPAGVTERVMDSISRPKGEHARFNLFWSSIFSYQYRGMLAMAMVVLLVGVFLLGRFSVNRVVTPVELAGADSSPEMVAGDAMALFKAGRELVEADKPHEALGYFQRAALLEPDNVELAYWQGVGYWLTGDQHNERQSYLRGLETAPQSVPLLENLGHNYLGTGEYQQALQTYQAILEVSADRPMARYNTGLIYRKLGMIDDETDAWRSYLQVKRTGKWAFKAVDRLNGYGDFSYRAYRVGIRKLILDQDVLLTGTMGRDGLAGEVSPLAAMLESNKRLRLDIVVFKDGDIEGARQKAWMLKRQISSLTRHESGDRIKLSWYGEPEKIQITENEDYELPEGVLIFGSYIPEQAKEMRI